MAGGAKYRTRESRVFEHGVFFPQELRERGIDFGTRELVEELQEVVVALAGQVATLEEERHGHERMKVEMKAAEQEITKLSAEVAQRGVRDQKMVTLEAANAEITRRVKAEL